MLAYGWKQYNPTIQSFIDDSLQNIQGKQTLALSWINLTRWKNPGDQESRIFPGRTLESDLSLNGNTGVTSTLLGCCRAARVVCSEVAQNNIPGSVLQTQVLVFLNLFLHEYRMNTRVTGTIQHLPQIRSVCYCFSRLEYSFCNRRNLPKLFSYLYLYKTYFYYYLIYIYLRQVSIRWLSTEVGS